MFAPPLRTELLVIERGGETSLFAKLRSSQRTLLFRKLACMKSLSRAKKTGRFVSARFIATPSSITVAICLRSHSQRSRVHQSKDKEALHPISRRPFGTACRIPGIRDLHWHDLRHTCGTRLAEAGCSEPTIASLMGHSDPQTTRRYTHATDRAKRAAVEAVRVLRENVCHNSRTAAKAAAVIG